MKVLGIETSCDETAVAIVEDGRRILSSVVSSQIDLHARFGGVVPEVASRAHVESLNAVVAQALVEGGSDFQDLGAVGACVGPGLAGALIVGTAAGKAISAAAGIPFVGVNHLEAHLHAAWLEPTEPELPMVVLIVSGGHTMLVTVRDHGDYEVLGETVDDAAGEAFDKVGRFLGLGYPGGAAIDRLALDGDPAAISFPRPMRDDGLVFSFAGLKTAVVNYCRDHSEAAQADVAASFQEAVVDTLCHKLARGAREQQARTIAIGGGVAANSQLRTRVLDLAEELKVGVLVPSLSLCTDNGATIASTAFWQLQNEGASSLTVGIDPNLHL